MTITMTFGLTGLLFCITPAQASPKGTHFGIASADYFYRPTFSCQPTDQSSEESTENSLPLSMQARSKSGQVFCK